VREEQILDAAVRVFSERGYHVAAVDDVAAAAGISKPMVYAYLGTKEELFAACLHREGVRLIEALAAAAGDGATADVRLWYGMRAFLGFVATHRDGWTVLFRRARGQEPFDEIIVALRARMAEVIAGMFSHAGAPDPMALAITVTGAAEAFADQILDHPGEDPAAAATRLVAILWTGAARLIDGVTWTAPAV
jgi:AcrR family transcriptional regulator